MPIRAENQACDFTETGQSTCESTMRCFSLRPTFLLAFLPPQQVVFCQDAPVATRLGRLEEVLRFQE